MEVTYQKPGVIPALQLLNQIKNGYTLKQVISQSPTQSHQTTSHPHKARTPTHHVQES